MPKDYHNHELKIGDEVFIPAKVVLLHDFNDMSNAIFEAILPMPGNAMGMSIRANSKQAIRTGHLPTIMDEIKEDEAVADAMQSGDDGVGEPPEKLSTPGIKKVTKGK